MKSKSAKGFQSAQEYAYNYLRARILSRDVTDGRRLDLDAIARNLGMSRMPVREAVRQLSAEGFLTIHARRGVTVTPLASHDIVELFQVRAVLEGLAVRLAIERASVSAERLSRLDQLLEDMEATKPDTVKWLRRHDALHEYICSESDSPRLTAQIRNLRQSVEPYMRVFLAAYKPEMPEAEHLKLVEVIKGGDPLLAETAMREHVTTAATFVVKFLESTGTTGSPSPGSVANEFR
jgi:DNA-binding GntR family transcriptional regulator